MKKLRGSDQSRRCKQFRIAMGYGAHGKQKEFAARIGVEKDTWSHIEHGVPLSKDVAFKIMTEFPGVDPMWFWFGDTRGLSAAMSQLLGVLDIPPNDSSISSKTRGGSSA